MSTRARVRYFHPLHGVNLCACFCCDVPTETDPGGATPRLMGPPAGLGSEAGSSSSLTQDGGDYSPTVLWVLELNIAAPFQRGGATLPGS